MGRRAGYSTRPDSEAKNNADHALYFSKGRYSTHQTHKRASPYLRGECVESDVQRAKAIDTRRKESLIGSRDADKNTNVVAALRIAQ